MDILIMSPDPIVFGPPKLLTSIIGTTPNDVSAKYWNSLLENWIARFSDLGINDYRMVPFE